jgi:uncharacterized protein (DUF1499 family)
MSMGGKVLIGVVGLIVVVLAAAQLGAFSGKRPSDLGVGNGVLKSCPDTPNCVSTQAEDDEHRIEPIAYSGARTAARSRLLDVVRAMAGTRVVVEQADYIYIEFRTPGLRFVDDVEFHLDDETKVIHFRSASRLGVSDLGVNRRRMEEIRNRFGE